MSEIFKVKTSHICPDYTRSPGNSNPVQIGLEGVIRKLAGLSVAVKAAHSSNPITQQSAFSENYHNLGGLLWQYYTLADEGTVFSELKSDHYYLECGFMSLYTQ